MEIDAAGKIMYCNAAGVAALDGLDAADDCCAFFPDDMAAILQELVQKKETAFPREVRIGGTDLLGDDSSDPGVRCVAHLCIRHHHA